MSGPILIVDDEPDIRELIAYGLGRGGWEVETAGNGADALARLCGSRPGGIVLDLVLPDIHGLGILEIARQLWVDDRVPIIVVSCLTTPELQAQVMEGGADAFLPKPFILEELMAVVDRLCRKRSRRISSATVTGPLRRIKGKRRTRRKTGATR